MPSTSAKQHRFMAAVANNPTFAKKAGVPASVGQDFVQADKGRTFKDSAMKKPPMPMMGKKAAPPMGMKKGGAIDGVAKKGKTKGKQITMKRGGKC